MEKVNLKITGMSCGHCEKAVSNTLEDLGIEVIKVSAEGGFAEFRYLSDLISLDEIKEEIVEAGYGIAEGCDQDCNKCC